jgi:phosphate transport system substrate-binding protein
MVPRMKRALLILSLCMLPWGAQARDQIRIVGSSTVFPFVSAAAELFGRTTDFRTPIVEATGTGGGIKMFCDGVGDAFPDMANASRGIKPVEIEQCAENGIHDITEISIGYDGIVLANAQVSPSFALSKRALFLALAREVPRGGKLVENPYERWREIDPTLPDTPIRVYGPPPTSGTRDAFVELVMGEACEAFPEFSTTYPDKELRKKQCQVVREDGAFIEAGEDDNLIVQKLVNNHDALGLFGYSFLEQNAALVKANPVDGVMPSFEAIVGDKYKVARSLYVYVKGEQLGHVPGIAEFVRFLTSDAATGADGALVMKGLLPLPAADHKAQQGRVAKLGK